MKTKFLKKLTALSVSMLMVISLLPVMASAAAAKAVLNDPSCVALNLGLGSEPTVTVVVDNVAKGTALASAYTAELWQLTKGTVPSTAATGTNIGKKLDTALTVTNVTGVISVKLPKQETATTTRYFVRVLNDDDPALDTLSKAIVFVTTATAPKAPTALALTYKGTYNGVANTTLDNFTISEDTVKILNEQVVGSDGKVTVPGYVTTNEYALVTTESVTIPKGADQAKKDAVATVLATGKDSASAAGYVDGSATLKNTGFTGLKADTSYTLLQRVKATDYVQASAAAKTVIKTKLLPIKGTSDFTITGSPKAGSTLTIAYKGGDVSDINVANILSEAVGLSYDKSLPTGVVFEWFYKENVDFVTTPANPTVKLQETGKNKGKPFAPVSKKITYTPAAGAIGKDIVVRITFAKGASGVAWINPGTAINVKPATPVLTKSAVNSTGDLVLTFAKPAAGVVYTSPAGDFTPGSKGVQVLTIKQADIASKAGTVVITATGSDKTTTNTLTLKFKVA